MAMEYLYRLYANGDELLYAGITDDWTRRLREHWHTKPWAADVLGVSLETYPDRVSVAVAEIRAIRAERPRYNIQHNHATWDTPSTSRTWTAEEIAAMALLVIAGSYILYKITEAAIDRYRQWRLDREEYLDWKRDRDHLRQPTRHEQGEEQACEPKVVGALPAALTRDWPTPPSALIPPPNPVTSPPTAIRTPALNNWAGIAAAILIAFYAPPGSLTAAIQPNPVGDAPAATLGPAPRPAEPE